MKYLDTYLYHSTTNRTKYREQLEYGRKARYVTIYKGDYFPVVYVDTDFFTPEFSFVDDTYVMLSRSTDETHTNINYSTRRFAEVLSTFECGFKLRPFEYTFEGEPAFVNVRKGEVWCKDRKTILMMYTTNNTEVFESHDIKTESLKLYIASEFMNDTRYRTVYKKFKESVIAEAFELDIDVVVTSSAKIRKNLFRQGNEFVIESITDLATSLDGGIEEFFNTFDPDQIQQDTISEMEGSVVVRELERVVEDPLKNLNKGDFISASYTSSSQFTPDGTVFTTGGTGTTSPVRSARAITIADLERDLPF